MIIIYKFVIINLKTNLLLSTRWFMSGNIIAQSEYRLWYPIDTTNGQSGSPIYIQNALAVGVHTSGLTAWNGGKRIHEDMFNWMKSF